MTTMEMRTATMMEPDPSGMPDFPDEDKLSGWLQALALHGAEPEEHTRRVTHIAMRLAHTVGLSEPELLHLRRGAMLHDIGHLGVPEHILYKPDQLSNDEWSIIRQHPLYARQMLAPIEFLQPALPIPLYHHEKWDGSGYPHGLQGAEIPLAARIFAVADVWDVLSRSRPYRPAWEHTQIKEYIESQAGTHFDPLVVRAFCHLQTGAPFQTQIPRAGYVRDLPLLKMLSLLRMQQSSGVIVLVHHTQRGIIAVEQGYTIDAYVLRQGQRTNYSSPADAIQQMLGWSEAAFAFQENLALHGYSSPVARLHLHDTTIVRLVGATVQRQALHTLSQEHWRILGYLSSQQSIQALAAAVLLTTETTRAAVQELVEMGIVEVVSP
jgi:hypothetical protein